MASNNNPGSRSIYRNTIIFAVISALITVVLLVLVVAVPWAANYRLTFLTVNVGLLAIIIHAIVRINRHSNKMDVLQENAGNNRLSVDTCPDYFTAKYTNDGKTVCVPEYKAPRTGTVFRFREPSGNMDNLSLDDYDGLRAEDLCSHINSDGYRGVDQRYVPWVEMRAKCHAVRHAV